MKKITYLVAPLMVLPFLVGCNKGKTYNVSVSELSSEHLKFTDKNGKEINAGSPAKATEGQDFVFNIEGTEAGVGIEEWGVFTFVGETQILDFKFEPANVTNKAKVTIPGTYVKDAITLAGLETRSDCYICEFPYIYGAHVMADGIYGEKADGTRVEIAYDSNFYFGYVPKNVDLHIWFEADDQDSVPGGDNIWLSKNGGDIETASKAEYASVDDSYVLYSDLKITADMVSDYLTIAARGSEANIMNELEWGDIKAIVASGYAPYIFERGIDYKTTVINGQNHDIMPIDWIDDEEGNHKAVFQFRTALSGQDGKAIKKAWGEAKDLKDAGDLREANLTKSLQENGEIYNMLPDELKDIIEDSTDKMIGVHTADYTWTAQEMETTKLFLVSYAEIKGTDEALPGRVTAGEGTQYELYAHPEWAEAASVKALRQVKDAEGNLVGYWTRSPRQGRNILQQPTISSQAYTITTGGAYGYESIYSTAAIVPAFVI